MSILSVSYRHTVRLRRNLIAMCRRSFAVIAATKYAEVVDTIMKELSESECIVGSCSCSQLLSMPKAPETLQQCSLRRTFLSKTQTSIQLTYVTSQLNTPGTLASRSHCPTSTSIHSRLIYPVPVLTRLKLRRKHLPPQKTAFR